MGFHRLKDHLASRIGVRNGMARSVSTLVGGTVFAQVVGVLALPILTRLYTPAEFSMLAVYASLLGILAVVACLRFEIAIPLPESEVDAFNLLIVALCSSLAIAAAVGFATFLFADELAALLSVPEFRPFFWLVPVGVWLVSSYSAVQYWATRKHNFRRIARTRMVQALGGVGIQVGTGVMGGGPLGLLLGHMVSSGSGLVGLGLSAWREGRGHLRTVTTASLRSVMGRYSRFPKYSMLDALANNLGVQAPVIIIAAMAVGPEAGFLMLATKVMTAPMSLVGGSVAQVYLAHAPEKLREGALGQFTASVITGLSRTGVGPLVFAGIVAPPTFALVFGAEWRRAGEIVAWMAPWFVLRFLSSPVSMVMHVTGRQKQMLGLTVLGGGLRVGAVAFAGASLTSGMPEVYAAASAVVYLVYLLVFTSAAGVAPLLLLRAVLRGMPIVGAWAAAGVLFYLLLSLI